MVNPSPTVIVVEDEAPMRRLLKTVLAAQGYLVFQAESAVLVKHAGKTLTHRQLLHDVWGSARADQGHYLRIYMRQLRHKLEQEPARPRFLLTEVGVGYRLAAE